MIFVFALTISLQRKYKCYTYSFVALVPVFSFGSFLHVLIQFYFLLVFIFVFVSKQNEPHLNMLEFSTNRKWLKSKLNRQTSAQSNIRFVFVILLRYTHTHFSLFLKLNSKNHKLLRIALNNNSYSESETTNILIANRILESHAIQYNCCCFMKKCDPCASN